MKLFLYIVLAGTLHSKHAEGIFVQKEVVFELVHNGSISNIPDPREEIITGPEQLQVIFNHVNSGRTPAIPLPEIDFTKEALIFVNLGYRSSGGFSVQVDRIKKDSEGYTVFLSGESPGPGDMVTSAITYPWVLIKFEKPDKPVQFRRSL